MLSTVHGKAAILKSHAFLKVFLILFLYLACRGNRYWNPNRKITHIIKKLTLYIFPANPVILAMIK